MEPNPTVVFTEPRKVVIEQRDVPSPEAGEALIRTELTLISIGTELAILSHDVAPGSKWDRMCKYPATSGYCSVGEIVDVGGDVDRGRIGERVQSYGPHAKYVRQPVEMARPVHRDVRSEHAVFATMAEIAMQGVRRPAVRIGESVVVYGVGILGQLAVRFARLCGARPVLAVDVSARRLALLPDDPAVVAVNAQEEDVAARVKEATRGRMADVVIELTGAAALIPEELALLRTQGRLAVVSGVRGKTEIDFHDLCTCPSYSIIGVHNGSHPPFATLDNPWTKNRDVELFLDLVADGDIDVAPLISHREAFSEAPRLYEMLLDDRTQAMGVILDWSDSVRPAQ